MYKSLVCLSFLFFHFYIVKQMRNDLISFNIKKNKTKVTLTRMYIVLYISKPTTTVWVRELDNKNAMKVNVTKGNFTHTTQIHINKCIEQILNKPSTTSIGERHVWEFTYTNCCNRVLEKARTRTFYFKNVRLTHLVGL